MVNSFFKYTDKLKFSISSGGGSSVDENDDTVIIPPTTANVEVECRAETPRASQRKTHDGEIVDCTYVIYGPKGIPRLKYQQSVQIVFADGFTFTGTVKAQHLGRFNTTIWV